MDYEKFMTTVQEGIGDGSDAGKATQATLQTLGERIDREEARQLAAQLPPEVAPWLRRRRQPSASVPTSSCDG